MLWFLIAFAAAAQPVVTVSIDDFTPGHYWTWEYRKTGGELYSSERYTVLSVNGDEVVLEMSSTFSSSGDFTAHHRLRVSVDSCLASYKMPGEVGAWSFRMYYLDSGGWNEFVPPSTLAFEEKFNCNPHRHDSPEFKTEFKNSPAGELFTHLRWRRVPGTWFMNSGFNAGVAYEKTFSHSDPKESYQMIFLHSGQVGRRPPGRALVLTNGFPKLQYAPAALLKSR